MTPEREDRPQDNLAEARQRLIARLLRGEAAARPAPTRHGDVVPASHLQESLWFLDRLGHSGTAYTVSYSLRLTGELDRGALAKALESLCARHESLRTVLLYDDDRLVQRILPASGPQWTFGELPQPGAERLAETLRGEAERPFVLGERLFRVRLFELGPAEHVLHLSLHHSITDGWSDRLLFEQLAQLYSAAALDRPAEPPGHHPQYADYAVAERERAEHDGFAAGLAYWAQHLAGTPPELSWPDGRRSVSADGRTLPFELPGPARTGPAAGDGTVFSQLFTAFAILVHRYTGATDLVIGVPMANRGRAEWEQAVGLFVNTVAVRISLAGHPTFATVHERARAALHGAQEHQDVPFSLVAAGLPSRGAGGPLQVMCNLVQEPASPELAGLTTVFVPVPDQSAKFDLELRVFAGEDGLRPELEYRTELFTPRTVEAMATGYGQLLSVLMTEPWTRVGAVALPGATVALAGAVRPAAAAGLHEGVLAQSRRDPHAIAVSCGSRTLSYAQLAAQSQRAAQRLLAAGVRPGELVGLCFDRGLDWPVWLLAVLRAGAAFVPLDPAQPAPRLDQLARVAALSLVVTDRPQAFPGRPVLDPGEPAPSLPDPPGPEPVVPTVSPAYAVLTSGSTGEPKCVAIGHAAVANTLDWLQETYPLDGSDVVLQSTSVGFDPMVWQVFWPLTTGARVVLPPAPQTHRDPAALIGLILREGVTVAHAVPSMLTLLLDQPGWPQCTTLRHLFAGGEPLPPVLVRRFLAAGRGRLSNFYGPAEAAIEAVSRRFEPGEQPARVPLGTPNANVVAHVLNDELRPVPTGATGELYLSGPGLGLGYVNEPGGTAERFLPDPFATEPGARVYRTGDLVRRVGDVLEYIGRADRQVKLRGQRIEPAEVEAALSRQPGVKQAAVAPRLTGEHQSLVAYLVTGPQAAPDQVQAAQLRRILPAQLVPDRFVRLQRLPVTVNGKVDYAALPAPPRLPAGEGSPPRPGIEEEVAAVWAEVLGSDITGRDADFFAAGGHSLSAARVVATIHRRLGVEVALRLLFDEPVLAEFASRVERLRSHGTAAPVPAIPARDRSQPAPISALQEHLWFLHELDPANHAYNSVVAYELHGRLDVRALRAALDELVARHDMLRTRFAGPDGHPVLQVRASGSVCWDAVEEHPDLDAAVLRAAEVAAQPFDLRAGPIARTYLARIGDGHHLLTVAVHHIAFDDHSHDLLLRDLRELYRAALTGAPTALPAIPRGYADFAAWEHGVRGGEAGQRQLAHWKEVLTGAPQILDLPTDRPRPPVRGYQGGAVTATLPADLRAQVEELAGGERTTVYSVLMGAWAAVLSRYSGQRDLCVGTTLSVRPPEMQEVIGFFVNTAVIRADLRDDPSLREVVRRIRQATLDAVAHGGLPFATLVRELAPARSLGHTPLVQVIFDLQRADGSPPQWPGLQVRPVRLPVSTAKFDLALSVQDTGAELAAELEFDSALFDEQTARRLLRHWWQLLRSGTAEPDRPVTRLALMTPAERAELLRGFNETDRPAGAVQLVHELFERQAARTPEATALVHGDRRVSYRELGAMADALAATLRTAGAAPEERVGILMERGVAMFVGVLGTLKAGAAYVPLDPGQPPHRLDLMAGAAGLTALLSHAATRALAEAVATRCDATLVMVDEQPETAPAAAPVAVHPDNVAYVLHTSGSTGTPKGFMLSHRALVNLMRWDREEIPVRPGAAVLQFNSLSFDASFVEMFAAWQVGGRLVVPEHDGVRRDPESVLDLLERERVERWDAPYAGLINVAQWARVESRPRRLHLRAVMSGGEQVQVTEDIRAWLASLDDCAFYNQYGPGEVNRATSHRLPGAPGRWPTLPPIGFPAFNTRVYILDPQGEPVPIGAPGEIYIGGANLARGYLGRPDLTAERFGPDPFTAEEGARLYRTGDIARYRADGTIEFLRRIDDQVKIRGYRVEPGEVEAVLQNHPGVREAVVTVAGNDPADRRLIGYVLPARPGLTEAELAAHLVQRLPDYMLPRALVLLSEFPHTGTGKVDRRALPEPPATPAPGSTGAVAPGTQSELAEIFARHLGVAGVAAHDNFFDLGGHSLLGTRVVADIRARLDRAVTIKQLFQHPTVAALATLVDSAPPPVDEPVVVRRNRRPGPRESGHEEVTRA